MGSGEMTQQIGPLIEGLVALAAFVGLRFGVCVQVMLEIALLVEAFVAKFAIKIKTSRVSFLVRSESGLSIEGLLADITFKGPAI